MKTYHRDSGFLKSGISIKINVIRKEFFLIKFLEYFLKTYQNIQFLWSLEARSKSKKIRSFILWVWFPCLSHFSSCLFTFAFLSFFFSLFLFPLHSFLFFCSHFIFFVPLYYPSLIFFILISFFLLPVVIPFLLYLFCFFTLPFIPFIFIPLCSILFFFL